MVNGHECGFHKVKIIQANKIKEKVEIMFILLILKITKLSPSNTFSYFLSPGFDKAKFTS